MWPLAKLQTERPLTVVQRTYLELGTYLELSSSVRRSKDAWDPYIKNQHLTHKTFKNVVVSMTVVGWSKNI